MPIQPVSFPMLNAQQTNPELAGLQLSQEVIANALKTHLANLQAQKLSAEIPYAGDMAKSTAQYKAAMAKYLSNPYQMQRFMTPLGKTLNEQKMLGGGMGGSSGDQGEMGAIADNENEGNDYYGKKLQNMTTDADTRKRNLFATNIEKTLGFINPDDLSRYSGAKGTVNKLYEQGKSAIGSASPEYKDYVKSMNAAKFLSKQVRQFYGASITPEMDAQLQSFANPESWVNDPELTKDLFNQFKNILAAELGTYRGALKSTAPYQSQENEGQANVEGRVEDVRNIGKKQYAKINGQWYER